MRPYPWQQTTFLLVLGIFVLVIMLGFLVEQESAEILAACSGQQQAGIAPSTKEIGE